MGLVARVSRRLLARQKLDDLSSSHLLSGGPGDPPYMNVASWVAVGCTEFGDDAECVLERKWAAWVLMRLWLETSPVDRFFEDHEDQLLETLLDPLVPRPCTS